MTTDTLDINLRLLRRDFSLSAVFESPLSGVTAIFGRSGCGKTTLLRALAGLEKAHGHVRMGKTCWQDSARRHTVPTHQRRLGMVFQDAALFPHLDVRDNLCYGWRRMPEAERPAMAPIIDLLGLEPLLARATAGLSGGERQRVAIGRALLTRPQLLLMDEPLSALDVASRNAILPYLEALPEALQLPILYVSHAPDEVARLADHLVLLEAGEVVASGPLTALAARPEMPFAHGEDAGVVWQATVARHDENDALTVLDHPAGALWVAQTSRPAGSRQRLRVHARDVSLALTPPTDSSISNILPATVEAVLAEDRGGQMLVRLQLGGGTPLMARLTRRSVRLLGLAPGLRVHAQIKGVALLG